MSLKYIIPPLSKELHFLRTFCVKIGFFFREHITTYVKMSQLWKDSSNTSKFTKLAEKLQKFYHYRLHKMHFAYENLLISVPFTCFENWIMLYWFFKYFWFQTVAFPANEVHIEIDTTNTHEDYEMDAVEITGQCWLKRQNIIIYY